MVEAELTVENFFLSGGGFKAVGAIFGFSVAIDILALLRKGTLELDLDKVFGLAEFTLVSMFVHSPRWGVETSQT